MEVNPDKQNIDQLFSTTNYHIDFYQREYKWKDDEVKRLIDDIFYHFEHSYAQHRDGDATDHNVSANHSWCYLNIGALVAHHFKQNVLPLGYKAFLVAVDREACAKYKRSLDKLLPPERTEPDSKCRPYHGESSHRG